MTTWDDRFRAFAASKLLAAESARLPGYRTLECHDDLTGLSAIGNLWTARLFDGPFFESPAPDARLPAVNTVFVQSADGNTGTDNPLELGGGLTDKHLIYEGLSSVRADAIMTGSHTIAGSQMVMAVWHPELVRLRADLGLERYPAQVVATRQGALNFDAELLYNVPALRVFILTGDDGARAMQAHVRQRPWITVIATGPSGDLVEGLETLRAAHGIRRISSIGGRTVATALIEAGVIQDLYLTTSPRPGGEAHTPFYTGVRDLRTRLVVRKTGRDEEAGVVFEHSILT